MTDFKDAEKLVAELLGFATACGAQEAGDGAFMIRELAGRDSSQLEMNLRAVLRSAAALIESQRATIERVERERDEARRQLRREEDAHVQTIEQRDSAEKWADKLARAIGGEDIGEHSNLNSPWANALEIAEAAEARVTALEAEKAGLVRERGQKHDEANRYVNELVDAKAIIRMFDERISANGEWDDGCFYYRGTSASELQEPLNRARASLSNTKDPANG